jgi:hypothetical protein
VLQNSASLAEIEQHSRATRVPQSKDPGGTFYFRQALGKTRPFWTEIAANLDEIQRMNRIDPVFIAVDS